jgi:hypothetical protein
MTIRLSKAAGIVVIAAATTSLCGCSAIRNLAGMNKMPPDEFAVLTKAPLVIPPDFGLMPPKSGAAPTNQSDPTGVASRSIYGSDLVGAGGQGTVSAGEEYLLAKTGANKTDPNIREEIVADNTALLAADDSFADSLMFWQEKKPDQGKAVDADTEAKRLADKKEPDGGKPAEGDSGWFWGLFDWL